MIFPSLKPPEPPCPVVRLAPPIFRVTMAETPKARRFIFMRVVLDPPMEALAVMGMPVEDVVFKLVEVFPRVVFPKELPVDKVHFAYRTDFILGYYQALELIESEVLSHIHELRQFGVLVYILPYPGFMVAFEEDHLFAAVPQFGQFIGGKSTVMLIPHTLFGQMPVFVVSGDAAHVSEIPAYDQDIRLRILDESFRQLVGLR